MHHCDVIRNTTRCNTSDPLAFLIDRSRNNSGTFRNGTRVKRGVYQPLDTGDVITFSPPKETSDAQTEGEGITLVFYSAAETTVSDFQKDYFVFGKTLGSGTSADVRKCRERRTGKCFAVKIVHLTKFTSTKFLSRIESEVPMLEKVNHPNIVKFIRRYRDSSALYIVLELFAILTIISSSFRHHTEFFVLDVQQQGQGRRPSELAEQERTNGRTDGKAVLQTGVGGCRPLPLTGHHTP